MTKKTLTLIKKPLTLIKKCSPLSSGWVSGCHPAAGPALPFSRSEDFSALWVLEKSENVLSLLTSVRGLEKSVVILIISQIDRVKLRVREICHCCFKRVFNWWYLKRITHLFTVVFLMLVFSDVLKLLVFWPTPGSRCERREPSRQLFRSSLYNSCKRKALIIIYFWAKKKHNLCSSRLRIVKHSLCGRWAPQKGMEYISRRHVLVKYISKYLVKHISKYPSKFFIPSGLANCEIFCFVLVYKINFVP